MQPLSPRDGGFFVSMRAVIALSSVGCCAGCYATSLQAMRAVGEAFDKGVRPKCIEAVVYRSVGGGAFLCA